MRLWLVGMSLPPRSELASLSIYWQKFLFFKKKKRAHLCQLREHSIGGLWLASFGRHRGSLQRPRGLLPARPGFSAGGGEAAPFTLHLTGISSAGILLCWHCCCAEGDSGEELEAGIRSKLMRAGDGGDPPAEVPWELCCAEGGDGLLPGVLLSCGHKTGFVL